MAVCVFLRSLTKMRLPAPKRIFWMVMVGCVVTLALLLLSTHNHHTAADSDPSQAQPLPSLTESRSRATHVRHTVYHRRPANPLKPQDFPVPPRPPRGDVPPAPIPGLREDGVDGEMPSTALREADPDLTEEEENPIQLADGLWSLLLPHREVEWNQQKAPSTCEPKHHIFFGKVHKTGSSTVANIMQRYGFTRELNFVLPRKYIGSNTYNYFASQGQQYTRRRLIPAPLGEHYDILWCHGIYNRSFFHQVMPQDTVYVTMLRHPLSQFQSSFEYYGMMGVSYLSKVLAMNLSNPLSEYLHNTAKYENPMKLTTFVRNKQSQDLGMDNRHVLNATLRHQHIQQLDQDFQLVMLTEFFDESLVLLRRLLCWGIKDILYITKNKNKFKQRRTFSQEDLQRHRILNIADFDLYDFFYHRFEKNLKEQKSEFHQEVQYFKGVLQIVQSYCVLGSKKPLEFPASAWGEDFNISRPDCNLMQKPELPFLNDLMVEAIHKYDRSVLVTLKS